MLDIHTNPKNPVIGDRALADEAEDVARLGARDHPRRCRAKASPPAASIFPGTATPAPIRISSCRWSSIRRSGCARVEFVPFRAAIEAGVATIMTAHVLVPSLDEERPATLSRRIVTGLLRDELGFDGVILSDDLEMKAIAASYAVPEAAVLAIEAGCDGVLICSGDHDDAGGGARGAGPRGRSTSGFRYARVDDALKRQRRAKERFLAAPVGREAARAARRCAQSLGRDEHRAHRRRDGALRCDAASRARSRPAIALAVVAPASPFAREEFDGGVAEIRAARVRAGLRRRRCSRGSATSPGRPSCARGAIRARVARPVDRRR